MAKKKISELARMRLKTMPLDGLIALDLIRKDLKISMGLMDVTHTIIEQERDSVIALDSANPNLPTLHANHKGWAGGLTFLGHLIEGSSDELERREND